MIGFLGHLHLVEHDCLLSAVKWAVSTLFYLVLGVTCLPCTCFESFWTPLYCGSNRIMYSWTVMNIISDWGCKEGCILVLSISPLIRCMFQCRIGLHLRNTSSKKKGVRISIQGQESIKPNPEIWVWTPWWLQSTCPWSWFASRRLS